MDDAQRFKVIAEASSVLARLHPEAPDDVIADAVTLMAVRAIEKGIPDDEFTVFVLATGASDGVEIFLICDKVAELISLQIEGRGNAIEIDTKTPLSAIGLTDGDAEALRKTFSDCFEIDPGSIDFAAMESVSDLVEAIISAMPDDEDEMIAENPETCQHGVCGCSGNTTTYRESQDANVARLGYTFAPVLPGDDSPGFIYSLGMSEQDKVDLIFVGDYTRPTHPYLGMFIDIQLRGQDLPFGLMPADDPRNGFDVPIWVVAADEKLQTHAFGTVRRLRSIGSDKPARLAQVIMPDMQNRFPWDDGYDWIDQQAAKPETA